MSSSVLPFPPPMDSAPISFASAGTPSRTVPRRTYGRRRAASPPPEEEAFRSLFQPLPEPHISPAKGLLNRWSGASTSWRDSLALLDADRTGEIDAETAKRELDRLRKEARTVLPRPRASSPANEEDVGLEEAKKEMERMRREARGEVVSNMPTTTAKSGLEVPSGKLVTAFSSSSLTALPTSTPPSSPPKARANTSHCPAQSMEDETIPVRNPGMAKYSGRIKRVIASPDEEQSDDEPIRKRRSPPRGPSSPASVSDEETPRRAPYSTMRPIRVASPTRDSTPTAEDDEAPLDNLQQFLSTLADDAKQPNDAREPSTESINDPAGLFDDEGMEKGGKSKNGKGGRALKVNKGILFWGMSSDET